jgi:hypothetical protein
MRTISVSIALALALVTAACGGDDDGGSSGETYDTQGEALEAFARATCERLEGCEMLGELTVEECTETGLGFACDSEGVDCDGPLPSDVTSEEINTCLAALDDVACDAEDLPASCDSIGGGQTFTALRTRR